MIRSLTASFLVALLAGIPGTSQVLPPGFNRADQQPPAQQQPTPQQPAQQPAAPQQQAAPAAQPGQPAAAPPSIAPPTTGSLSLQNASLTEVIDTLARSLKLNYILDPAVRGGVTINTYGDTSKMDNRTLLETILSINGFTMVQTGDVYRIVPLKEAQRLLPIEVNGKTGSGDEQAMLNLIFLKYATVEELAKLLDQFRGEHGRMWSYPAGNLLVIQDTRRNMRRLLDLIALFDNDTFANQRVKLFEVKNSRPSDLSKELEGILKSISLNDKNSPVRLIPVDRINTLIAVAPNPGVFTEVEKWLNKLDIAVQKSSGSVNNYVYRVKYGYAPTLGMAIMALYSGNPMAMMMLGAMGGMNGGMGMGGVGMGGMGMGGMYGGAMGMGGMYGGMGGMYGGMGGMYPGAGGMYGGMGGMYGGAGYAANMYAANIPQPGLPIAGTPAATAAAPGQPGAVAATDATGTYLGATPGSAPQGRMPRVIPNPLDNTLLIQATQSEYEGITSLLRDIDVPPRQVLIEAKIYEVSLNGDLSSGVAAFLRERGSQSAGQPSVSRSLAGSLQNGGLSLSAGALVSQSKELLAFISAQEVTSRSRLVSAPSLIATDSVPASLNVGQEVPTLTAQAITGAQSGGNSLFANSIQSRNTGVTLNVNARVNPNGIVTLIINQEVSAPIAPSPGAAIQSPSFSKRTVQTQVTVQDGDTIAIGGIISENNGSSSAGIPGLHRIPILGAAFGSRAYSKQRTELVIFLTPRVIYDMNDLIEAGDELKSRMKRVSKYIKE